MRFAFIAVERASHTVTILCRCLQVTPSGYYAWQRRPESQRARDDRRLTVLVRASFDASRQRYGSPRIHADLREQREAVSRKRVIRLMQADGLQARARKRYKLTTMSEHDQPVAANLLNRQFVAAAPNQRWVGDTTELVIAGSGKLYLAAVLDLFSRFIVGWALSAVNDRHLTIKALEMALKRRCPEIGLLHHSDQGCTYASEDYQALLEARGIVCSMSRRGKPRRGKQLTASTLLGAGAGAPRIRCGEFWERWFTSSGPRALPSTTASTCRSNSGKTCGI